MEDGEKIIFENVNELNKFFPYVLNKIKNGIIWENMIKIPGIHDQILLLEKGINEDLDNFKEQFLEIDEKKDEIIIKREKELDANEEKFINKSKKKIEQFKKIMKKFIKDLQERKIIDIKTPDDGANYVGIKKFKDELLEIEVYEGEQLNIFIKNFKEEIRKLNDIISDKTSKLKENLKAKKIRLNEKIIQIVNEIRKKIEDYSAIENPDIKDGKMEELISIFTRGEFNSEIGRVVEIIDEEISNLKDSLDKARSIKTENYFNYISNNNYYRNKERIFDVNDIYSMFYNQISEAMYNMKTF